MTKDVKFSCNFHVFFLFKNHADTSLMNDLPVIRSYVMRKGFWDRQGANIASR